MWGRGTQDLGFRANSLICSYLICAPAETITLKILDEDGNPTTAKLTIRDKLGRVYPSQAKRLAPDFAFHPQIYRTNNETLELPAGIYSVEYGRGPEYLVKTVQANIGAKKSLDLKLERWIDPSKMGWWSGDHHIHAAGCAHYNNPSAGVHALDMMRHCLGEDLKVGCNLTWGPCFDYQKQFFTGKDNPVSRFPYLLHYDVEVSGFGSHRVKAFVSPAIEGTDLSGRRFGTEALADSLPQYVALGKGSRGAVCGPAHSGWGLQIKGTDLPSYEVPPYGGIGANEYIVDVAHKIPGPDGALVSAVDFMSMVDTPYVWELNMWYHTLNCGYRTRISGETDFPCIYGERVGLGRSYVKLDKLSYPAWCEGIRAGANYVSDGFSHLIDFKVGERAMGEAGSELKLERPGSVHVTAKVAALLGEHPDENIRGKPYTEKPYWNIERARIGSSREVPVELIVNGYPVAKKTIVCDGTLREIDFEVKIEKSS